MECKIFMDLHGSSRGGLIISTPFVRLEPCGNVVNNNLISVFTKCWIYLNYIILGKSFYFIYLLFNADTFYCFYDSTEKILRS